LKEVHSHPMALAQCTEYFKKYPQIRLVESADTAESAARISKKHLKHTGAIGSTLAAEVYGLNLLAPNIETNPENFTRFLAVQPYETAMPVDKANKVSVSFTTSHNPGSLSRVLTMLAMQSANLTKIQSVPLIGRPFEYLFFADFTLDNPQLIPETLALLKGITAGYRVLGIYAEAE
jgi:prephenate dehydratase